ncbi:hypothetical protein niasHT_002551 [Heterodera trifolii]|uniref:Uncharacterized protein n=1 Tax=Heterodera trifolii TaxID=157864 RepID=A0ABD2MBA3_9BILA
MEPLILQWHYCEAAYDQEIFDTIQMINMCQFIHDHIAEEGEVENIAVITCGKEIEDARAQINERRIGAGPSEEVTPWRSMKGTFLMMVNANKFKRKQLGLYRKMMNSCVDGLVEKSEIRPDKKLVMQIDPRDLKEFDDLLKNGRAFIKRIVFKADYGIDVYFFIHLIEALLNPFTSANTIVEDIGISTPIIGIWDRDILVETLNEKYFDEMTYNPGEIPHWEVLYKMDDKIRAKMHFCQWAEHLNLGQKFRMWRYKKEYDPCYIHAGMSKLKSFISQDPAPKEICF